jgi:hypothetical protein
MESYLGGLGGGLLFTLLLIDPELILLPSFYLLILPTTLFYDPEEANGFLSFYLLKFLAPFPSYPEETKAFLTFLP